HAFAQRFRSLDRTIQIAIPLPMNEKRIRAGGDEFVEEQVWRKDHQVNFQVKASHTTQRFDDRGTHGKVGYEMAVHDVHVNSVRAGTFGFRDLFTETCEIGGEDRRSKFDGAAGHWDVFLLHLSLR